MMYEIMLIVIFLMALILLSVIWSIELRDTPRMLCLISLVCMIITYNLLLDNKFHFTLQSELKEECRKTLQSDKQICIIEYKAVVQG